MHNFDQRGPVPQQRTSLPSTAPGATAPGATAPGATAPGATTPSASGAMPGAAASVPLSSASPSCTSDSGVAQATNGATSPLRAGATPIDQRPARLPTLTSLRFVAALLVFTFHLSLNHAFTGTGPVSEHESINAFRFIAQNGGWFGVSFFFVLSGFVLAWSARPYDTLRGFWGRRLVKIYPNHLVTFLIALALFGTAGASANEAAANLLLLHAWIPDDSAFFSINHPSWSLSAEVLFYLAFPLLWWLARRVPSHRLWWAAAAVTACVWLMPQIAIALPAQPSFGPNHAASPLYGASVPQVWFAYAFPLTRALDFALGIIMARIVQAGRWVRIPVLVPALLTVASYVVGLYAPLLLQVNVVSTAAVALLLPALAVADVKGSGGILRSRGAVFLGEVSFAFYMVHDILLTLARAQLGARTLSLGAGLLVSAVILLASVAFACLLFLLIERPSTTWWSRRTKKITAGSVVREGARGGAESAQLEASARRSARTGALADSEALASPGANVQASSGDQPQPQRTATPAPSADTAAADTGTTGTDAEGLDSATTQALAPSATPVPHATPAAASSAVTAEAADHHR
ncbi:acyltransferase family protein [Kineococcus arenarius]|uniref:acyltransferase family protein n=1 Tax=unclassified Kineococcus TaxID=2621656 RepID=UPI003D7C86F0